MHEQREADISILRATDRRTERKRLKETEKTARRHAAREWEEREEESCYWLRPTCSLDCSYRGTSVVHKTSGQQWNVVNSKPNAAFILQSCMQRFTVICVVHKICFATKKR